MATHSSILAWRIPGTEEPGGLLSMGLHRIGYDWSNLAASAATLCFWKFCTTAALQDVFLKIDFKQRLACRRGVLWGLQPLMEGKNTEFVKGRNQPAIQFQRKHHLSCFFWKGIIYLPKKTAIGYFLQVRTWFLML